MEIQGNGNTILLIAIIPQLRKESVFRNAKFAIRAADECGNRTKYGIFFTTLLD